MQRFKSLPLNPLQKKAGSYPKTGAYPTPSSTLVASRSKHVGYVAKSLEDMVFYLNRHLLRVFALKIAHHKVKV